MLEADLTDMILAIEDSLLGLGQNQQLTDIEVCCAARPEGVSAEGPLLDSRPRYHMQDHLLVPRLGHEKSR